MFGIVTKPMYIYQMKPREAIKSKDVFGSIKLKDGRDLFRGTRVVSIEVKDIGGEKLYITDIHQN